MNLVYDTNEQPPSDDDLAEVREIGQKHIKVWRRRAALSTIALAMSIALVYPFLMGHMLHQYWDSVGQYLVYAAMALLVVFVFCTGMFYSAWQALRNVEKDAENMKHF
jgi:membrane protease YdiL (CAAX protease family)